MKNTPRKLLLYFSIAGQLLFTACTQTVQKPDTEFDVSVKNPMSVGLHPVILFDEAHNNMHTSSGTYSPFVNLMKNDGFKLKPITTAFDEYNLNLSENNILVIANARGKDKKYAPAFTDAECNFIAQWVYNGGSLLLIADHYPFGGAVQNLSLKFKVQMSNGETTDSVHFEGNNKFRDKLVFSRQNGLLPDNPISRGINPGDFITKVVSDRGQSLSIPDSAMVLLKLSDTAYQTVPDSIWEKNGKTYTRFTDPQSAKGRCQGLALKYGKGKVVILGEAAMITAQIYGTEKFGMNTPGNNNRQFALNLMRWLANKNQ